LGILAVVSVGNTDLIRKEYWKLWTMGTFKLHGSIYNTNFLNLVMKAILINPKDKYELKFVTDLLKKLGIKATEITQEEMEDLAMSKLLKKTDKSKKATKAAIMRKLRA
jgi:cellobiose-specific phosphotransferase system component IIB